MTCVVDASVACKWFFDEPLSDEALVLAASHQTLLAPDLIVAECASVAWRRMRDGQVPLEQAEAFLKALPAWFERLVPSELLHETALRIARKLNHPVYDCMYIALAAHFGSKLVTTDSALARRVRGTLWEDLVVLLGGNLTTARS